MSARRVEDFIDDCSMPLFLISERPSINCGAGWKGTVSFAYAGPAAWQLRFFCRESVENVFVFSGTEANLPHNRLTGFATCMQPKGDIPKPCFQLNLIDAMRLVPGGGGRASNDFGAPMRHRSAYLVHQAPVCRSGKPSCWPMEGDVVIQPTIKGGVSIELQLSRREDAQG